MNILEQYEHVNCDLCDLSIFIEIDSCCFLKSIERFNLNKKQNKKQNKIKYSNEGLSYELNKIV